MNDKDIQQFMNAFKDFMKHSTNEIDYYQKQKEAQNYTQWFYEQKAAELNVSTEYYIQEFI